MPINLGRLTIEYHPAMYESTLEKLERGALKLAMGLPADELRDDLEKLYALRDRLARGLDEVAVHIRAYEAAGRSKCS